MITDLHIENIAVIEKADIAFEPGFNVLTGETGAGKSIVIDAISAILGGRTSRELVRSGADYALVRAVFADVDVAGWLAENELEDASDELILQRRISADGKSSCRVNGVPVTVQQMHALGGLLLDIHGQNDGRQLMDETRHLDYLDRFMNAPEIMKAYQAEFEAFRSIEKEIDRLSMGELEKARLVDTLNATVEELSRADVKPGEEEELEARCVLMKNAGKLTEYLENAYATLYEADENAIDLVSSAEQLTDAAAAVAPELSDAAKSISDARFLLQDAAERIHDLRGTLDFSEAEYDAIETRLSLLRRLERKYSTDEAGLVQLLSESRQRLDEVESAGDLLLQLQKDLEKQRSKVLAAGRELSDARRKAAQALSARVVSELRDLSMPSVQFLADFSAVANANGFDATGCDDVKFLMSANAGEKPGRISHIASGGELSRIMLALKSVFSEHDAVQSMVFDEIDTGVSGIAAQRVGEKMGLLSRKRQLLCITHLPQIAAMADTHFNIRKREADGRTFTTVERLDMDGRIRELARLHGGDAVTETTLRSAREQLEAAERFKKGANL